MKDNYSAWDIPSLDCPADPSREEVLAHLISWGVLAASTHNAQPWKFQACARLRQIRVIVDETYILPESDPTGRQSYVSVGCAVENILFAIGAYGLTAAVSYEEDGATLVLGNGIGSQDADAKMLSALRNRSMNRAPYLEKHVEHLYQDAVAAMAACFRVELDLIEDRATREMIAELQHEADGKAIGSLAFRNELADYLLPNSSTSGRGIVGRNFGLSDQMAEDIHAMMGSENDLPPGMFQEFSLGGKRAMLKSPLLFIVSIEEEDEESLMKAGQMLQYAAVHAQASGLSMAILAALTEMSGFPEQLAAVLGRSSRPVVVARIGYAAAGPMPKSPRVPAGELTEIVS